MKVKSKMALKFKNKKIVIINFSNELEEKEVELIKENYDIKIVEEILYKCKNFKSNKKSWYLQSVDWAKLVPEKIIRNEDFALKLPYDLPLEISIYIVSEISSELGRMPKILEHNNGNFHRIIDLQYEINFSKQKQGKKIVKKNQEEKNFNKADYHDRFNVSRDGLP